jgi:hypothetical protein
VVVCRRTSSLRDALRRHTAWVDVALGTVVAVLGVVSLWSVPDYLAYDFRRRGRLGVVLAVAAGAAVVGALVAGLLPASSVAVRGLPSATLQLGYSSGRPAGWPLLVLLHGRRSLPVATSVTAPRLSSPAADARARVLGPIEPTVHRLVRNSVVLLTAWSLGRSVRGRRPTRPGSRSATGPCSAAGRPGSRP